MAIDAGFLGFSPNGEVLDDLVDQAAKVPLQVGCMPVLDNVLAAEGEVVTYGHFALKEKCAPGNAVV